jgi:hypothetical protein
MKVLVKEGSIGWNGGISNDLPSSWGDRGIYYSGSIKNDDGELGGVASGAEMSTDVRYSLSEQPQDRAIASVYVDGDASIDAFVLTDGKVYDTAIRVINRSNTPAKLTLPDGYFYEKFRATKPLLILAASTNLLTITRTDHNTFLVRREELVSAQ